MSYRLPSVLTGSGRRAPAAVARLSARSGFAVHSLLLLWGVIAIYPVVVMFMSSFKSQLEIFRRPFGLPKTLRFDNYLTAWSQARMGAYLVNSVAVSTVTVALILAAASMAAYVFARYSFRGKQILRVLFLAGLVLPGRLALVPQFILIRDLGLLDTHLALVLVYTAGAMPLSIFILANFFERIPQEIEESAILDGASVWVRYSRVSLPLMLPALATVAIFNLVGVWNDFFLPLVLLRTPAKMTIPVGLNVFFGEYWVQWNLVFAALSIASLPLIVVFLVASRQFIAGLTAGALKG